MPFHLVFLILTHLCLTYSSKCVYYDSYSDVSLDLTDFQDETYTASIVNNSGSSTTEAKYTPCQYTSRENAYTCPSPTPCTDSTTMPTCYTMLFKEVDDSVETTCFDDSYLKESDEIYVANTSQFKLPYKKSQTSESQIEYLNIFWQCDDDSTHNSNYNYNYNNYNNNNNNNSLSMTAYMVNNNTLHVKMKSRKVCQQFPSHNPTYSPTNNPSQIPSSNPTQIPTIPTNKPSDSPTESPSNSPTAHISEVMKIMFILAIYLYIGFRCCASQCFNNNNSRTAFCAIVMTVFIIVYLYVERIFLSMISLDALVPVLIGLTIVTVNNAHCCWIYVRMFKDEICGKKCGNGTDAQLLSNETKYGKNEDFRNGNLGGDNNSTTNDEEIAKFDDWSCKHKSIALWIILLSIFDVSLLELFNSRLFNFNGFKAPNNLKCKCVVAILIKDIPQLAVLLDMYIASKESHDDGDTSNNKFGFLEIAAFVLITNILSAISTVLCQIKGKNKKSAPKESYEMEHPSNARLLCDDDEDDDDDQNDENDNGAKNDGNDNRAKNGKNDNDAKTDENDPVLQKSQMGSHDGGSDKKPRKAKTSNKNKTSTIRIPSQDER